jgi:hypothetical protein
MVYIHVNIIMGVPKIYEILQPFLKINTLPITANIKSRLHAFVMVKLAIQPR